MQRWHGGVYRPMAGEINQTDANRRALQARIQDMQSRRNQVSKNIGAIKAKGGDADSLIAEVNDIKAQLPSTRGYRTALAAKLETYLLELPNILDGSVPDGNDEADNALIRAVGDIPQFSFKPKDHVEIGEGLGQMDFTLGAKLAGARFVVLSGQLARLERAIAALHA